ncbi:MAG: hypothetical protein ABR887_07020 [Methanoregulaceae archaeon]|jgi:hypothetical protein
MRAAEILGTKTFEFIEPSFADLINTNFNELLLHLPGDEALLLIDEHEEPLTIAIHSLGKWTAGTFLFRRPTAAVIERFEELNGEIYQENKAVWTLAVREYYSLQILEQIRPAVGDLNTARLVILENLIKDIWGQDTGGTCLDFCCGSGVGSQVLRTLRFSPVSCDNDSALLSLGLSTGRLKPEETMCIDATIASRYIDPLPRGIGIMMGEINNFSKELWQHLVTELFALTNETVITVGTKPEADLVKDWGESLHRSIKIWENAKDPIYDRWICSSIRE